MGNVDIVQSVIRIMAKYMPDTRFTKNDVIEIVENAIKNPVYNKEIELLTSTFRVTPKNSDDELLDMFNKVETAKQTPVKEEIEANQAHPLEERVIELEKTVEALKLTGCIALGDIKEYVKPTMVTLDRVSGRIVLV